MGINGINARYILFFTPMSQILIVLSLEELVEFNILLALNPLCAPKKETGRQQAKANSKLNRLSNGIWVKMSPQTKSILPQIVDQDLTVCVE